MIVHSPSCHCIVLYGVAWYCIVGFGARAVSRKTPTYFILLLLVSCFLTGPITLEESILSGKPFNEPG